MKKKSVAAYIDLIVCSIVVVIGFIGTKIILSDLLDGIFNKDFNDIAIVMIIVFILAIVLFGIQIPKTIKELNQDVETLQRINAYYKTELSKPQHMSVGAIARQEGFKMPLASSSINYRKNNLGTGQATLLKFGNKES